MRQRSNSMCIQMQAIGCVEDITIWLSCYAWGSQAETIKRSVTKGALLFVQGDFTSHPYTTEDGKKEVSLEVNVERFSFADGSKPQENDLQSGTRLCTLSFHGQDPSPCC